MKKIEINVNVDVQIDCSANEGVKMMGEESYLKLLDVNLESGRLYISPKSPKGWVKASMNIQIEIGAPSLNFVQLSTYNDVSIKNVNQEEISVMAIMEKSG